MHKTIVSFIALMAGLGMTAKLYAQTETPVDGWDNVLYYSNRLAWGSESWRQSVEFQTRFRNDFADLEQWHLEYVATYLASEHLEVVPDFRFTRKGNRVEYRPGFGFVFKHTQNRTFFVHQIKYQYDIRTNETSNSQGARYGMFVNHLFNEHWVGSFLAGGLYEWGPSFSGFLGLRAGVAAAYIFNEVHSLNVGWFYGLLNDKNGGWTHIGIPSFQLIINIRKKFKYQPAKYINF